MSLQPSQSVIDRNSWATPRAIFEKIEKLVGVTYDIDLCASAENAKCSQYIDKETDVFKVIHSIRDKVCWLNPPYSVKANQRYTPKDFFRLCQTLQIENRCDVTCLVFVNLTGSKAFQKVIGATPDIRKDRDIELYFWPGRIKFLSPTGVISSSSPTYSSMIVRFRRSS